MMERKLFKILVFIFIGWVFPSMIYAQLLQPNRFEKQHKLLDEDFSIVSLEEEGLALIQERSKIKNGKKTWDIILLDTALQETASLEAEMDIEANLIGFDHAPGFIYFLFAKRQLKGEMTLVSVDRMSKEIISYPINTELTFEVTQFSKAGENFAFGGYVNMESAVLLFSPASKNIKIVPGFFKKNVELVDMRANHNQTFNTVLIDKTDRYSHKIIFRTFDGNGKQILETITDIEYDIVIQNGMSSALKRDDLIIMGTWGKRNIRQASGFYTLPVNPFTKQTINRIYFGQLEHYVDYLKPKKAARVKAKTKQAIEIGKVPDFTNSVMPYAILEQSNGFLLLAESYVASGSYSSPGTQPYNQYPGQAYSPYAGYYPSSPYYARPPWYNNYTQGNNMTDNEAIKSVHGVLIAVDASGNVLWDYSMKLEDIKKPYVEQTLEFAFTKNTVEFIYKKESELMVKKIDLVTKEVTESTEKIKLMDDNDKIHSEDESIGTIKKWFGSSFYVWGYHKIRNNASADKTRDVFYINKVVVR